MLVFLSLIETEDERDAIEKIYHEHFDWMLKTAFYFLKNNEDAEDVIQDVFVSLVKNKVSFPIEDEERLRAYLFICIRNASLALNKKKKKSTVDFSHYTFSTKDDMQQALIEKDLYNEALSYINTIPPIYKDVLVLNIVYEKSTKEISKILNIPFKTAETRLRRAKIIIKNRFKELGI